MRWRWQPSCLCSWGGSIATGDGKLLVFFSHDEDWPIHIATRDAAQLKALEELRDGLGLSDR